MKKEKFSLEQIFNNVENDFKRYKTKLEFDHSEHLGAGGYSIFYSHPLRTLQTEGSIYFMGINPKRENRTNEKIFDFELESLSKWKEKDLNYHSFDKNYEPDWERKRQDKCIKILETIIKELRLEINYKDILVTNFNFFKSNNVKELVNDFGIPFDSCWKYHKELLKIVKPNIIVCYGNGEKNSYGEDSGYRYLRDRFRLAEENKYFVMRNSYLKFVKISIDELGEVSLVGIPHLSRISPFDQDNTFNIKFRELLQNHFLNKKL